LLKMRETLWKSNFNFVKNVPKVYVNLIIVAL